MQKAPFSFIRKNIIMSSNIQNNDMGAKVMVP